MSNCQYVQSLYPSSVGILRIIASQEGLVGILWDNEDGARIKIPRLLACTGSNQYIKIAKNWLDHYFAINNSLDAQDISGKIELLNILTLQVVPYLLFAQFTALEKSAILELQNVPYGETASYQEIARRIGNPRAVRAVASAIGKNPFSIILPCHRIVRNDGGLGGFAGGLENKAHLLQQEKSKS